MSKKLNPFSLEHNLGKCCPILIIISLLQTKINYGQVYPKTYHLKSACKMNKNVSANIAGMIS